MKISPVPGDRRVDAAFIYRAFLEECFGATESQSDLEIKRRALANDLRRKAAVRLVSSWRPAAWAQLAHHRSPAQRAILCE